MMAYDIVYENLNKMFFNVRIEEYGNKVMFRLVGNDAKAVTKATIKRWFRNSEFDVEVSRERGNIWGRAQNYYNYEIIMK